MKNIILTIYVLLITTLFAHAQVVEMTEFDSTSTGGETYSELFDQASVSFSDISPMVTLKSFKFSALIGKGEWDMYIYNTVPGLSLSVEDTAKALSTGILSQIGGLLNMSLSKVGYFGNGGDKLNREVKGGQIDFRVGGKVLDALDRTKGEGADFLVPILQSSLDVRYLIPLVSPDHNREDGEFISNIMQGNLSVRVYGTAMQILRSPIYDRFFINERGILPKHTVFTGNVELNLFVTNEFYLSLGYSISNEPMLPARTFFSISYAGQ